MNLFGNGNDSSGGAGPSQPPTPTLILPDSHVFSVRLEGQEIARVTAPQVSTDAVGSLVFIRLFMYAGDALPYKHRIFAAGTWDDCEVVETITPRLQVGSQLSLT